MYFDFNVQFPIHVAAKNDDLVVLQALLKHNPDTIELRDGNDRTALQIAALHGHETFVKMLRIHGFE